MAELAWRVSSAHFGLDLIGATRFATGRAIFWGSPPGDPDNGCLYGHSRHNGKGPKYGSVG
jgi:hypothetical protein